MQIEELYQLFSKSKKITIDSRLSETGAIFFGLKGDNVDGNKFAENAIENGCSYAIIDNPEYLCENNTILVNDVLKTLQDLAKYHRQQFDIPIIAITGTNGKTTTKELIVSVLSKKYSISSTKDNLNNHIGVPLTLLTINEGTQIGVIEMGANHVGEITELCKIALPNYGIITNIGKAHLEGTPIVQYNTQTGKRKVIAFLFPYFYDKYGYIPGGTFSIKLDDKGEQLFILFNGAFTEFDPEGGDMFGDPSVMLVHIPESERR